jgi:hypothetical protein
MVGLPASWNFLFSAASRCAGAPLLIRYRTMWVLQHPILFLLAYKEVVGLLIQLGLLVATFALIRVGVRQARAARSQARAANRQVRAAQEQIEAAKAQARAAEAQVTVVQQQVQLLRTQVEIAIAQSEEMKLQGQAARLPVFKVWERDSAYQNSPAVLLNAGAGPAFDIQWRFLKPRNELWKYSVYALGTLAAGSQMDIDWSDDTELHKLRANMIDEHGISIECVDTAKQRHTTVVKRTETGEFRSYPS